MTHKINDILKQMQKELVNKKVMLACSTGVDSMVLFDLLCQLKKNNEIIISHVNHRKREQSEIEEKFIIDYCLKLNIKCYVKHLPHYEGSNFQSWSRNERYKFFEEISIKENIDILLLAHHANDNLETIILRFIRNASLEGYAGIRQKSKYHQIDIYRPLLDITKNDIIEYAKEKNIMYFDDESNASDDYTRNRIRHHIIPVLEQENPSLLKSIKNYSKTLFEANDFIENYETNFINTEVIVHNNNGFYAKFMIDKYSKESDFMQEQILFRLLKPFSLSKECIRDTIKQVLSTKHNIVQNVNDKLVMIKEYGYVIFTDNYKKDSFYLKIETDGIYELPNNCKLEVTKNICNFITGDTKLWYNINSLPIIIRTRNNGDKIVRKKGTITVSNYLTNYKVPVLERNNILLLCDENDMPISILGYIIK